MSITGEQWRALSPLLERALELPDAAREAWLAQLDATQPALSPLLRKLLAADRQAEQGWGFETASVLVGAGARAGSNFEAGQLMGTYRLIRPLGRGGMGEVWLARQVEGGITRDVALKLPILLGPASLWRERFRRERDILASLQHPNIAMLFDAGVADLVAGAGQPYLAMEYVDGVSLPEYAAERAMLPRDRVALFRQVLAAVSCAHRQLVIHRDLKPSNILVSREGQVKLLDFGIAKLVEGEATASADDLTRWGGQLLTYRYAAPEQVQGESLSTATDVYSLGVVLHELLTGQSPYPRVRNGAAPGLADFQPQDFVQPSTLTTERGLAGDLDAIVLKALRRVPADRYATVEAFDEDLLRYIERRPVLARRGSRRYLAGRFVTRHRLPLAAAAAVLLALVAGLVVADRERRLAVAAQARAERHFSSVRELANTFINEIEEDLRGVAGTLPVREKLARTSVRYLDSLSSESQVDPALLAELASGYRRVGEVFSGTGTGNLGDANAGFDNLLKSAAIFDTLRKQHIASRQILEDERRVRYALAGLYFGKQDPRWEQEDLRAIELMRQLADASGATPYDRVTAAGLLVEHIRKLKLAARASKDAAPFMAEAVSRLEAVAPRIGTDVRARGNLAITYFSLADLLVVPGASRDDLLRARDSFKSAGEILAVLARELPEDSSYSMQRDMVQSSHADALFKLGEIRQSETETADILARTGANLARDSTNMDVMLVHWTTLAQGIEGAYRNSNPALAARRALEFWRLTAAAPTDIFERVTHPEQARAGADYYGGLSVLAVAPRDKALACAHLRLAERYAAGDPATFPDLAPALRRCPN